MPLLLVQGQDSPPLQGLPIQELALRNGLMILSAPTASMTCIPADSFPFPLLKSNGPIGADLSIAIAMDALSEPPYQTLYELVCDRDYFVLTTNVDHQFQRAGFEKERLFYTQGDYGLWQCSKPCHLKTYNNRSAVFAMLESQGYVQDNDGIFRLPAGTTPAMQIPTDLVPHCPVCGRPFAMNLRADNTFVEDRGWHQAAQRWADFQQHHQDMHALYLELGVGYNTPSIIKFPFWNDVSKNPQATYACINLGESLAPAVLEHQAILIDADIASTLSLLKEHLSFS